MAFLTCTEHAEHEWNTSRIQLWHIELSYQLCYPMSTCHQNHENGICMCQIWSSHHLECHSTIPSSHPFLRGFFQLHYQCSMGMPHPQTDLPLSFTLGSSTSAPPTSGLYTVVNGPDGPHPCHYCSTLMVTSFTDRCVLSREYN